MQMTPLTRSFRSASRRKAVMVLLALGAYAALMLLISWGINTALISELEVHGEQSNRQFTRMFTNNNWERLKPLLRLGATPEEAKANPNLDEITYTVQRFARGTKVVAVKIFNAQGLMLYATDSAQIGSDQSTSVGFLKAVRGQVATDRKFREKFISFDGELRKRELVGSYVPVLGDTGVEAVVEIYSDRTEAVQAIHQMALQLTRIFHRPPYKRGRHCP